MNAWSLYQRGVDQDRSTAWSVECFRLSRSGIVLKSSTHGHRRKKSFSYFKSDPRHDYLLTFYLANRLTFLSGISCGMLSGKSSDILSSDILSSDILPCLSANDGHRKNHWVISSDPHHDYLLTFPMIPTNCPGEGARNWEVTIREPTRQKQRCPKYVFLAVIGEISGIVLKSSTHGHRRKNHLVISNDRHHG